MSKKRLKDAQELTRYMLFVQKVLSVAVFYPRVIDPNQRSSSFPPDSELLPAPYPAQGRDDLTSAAGYHDTGGNHAYSCFLRADFLCHGGGRALDPSANRNELLAVVCRIAVDRSFLHVRQT